MCKFMARRVVDGGSVKLAKQTNTVVLGDSPTAHLSVLALLVVIGGAAVVLLAPHAQAGAPPAATGGPDFGKYRFIDSTAGAGAPSSTWTALSGGTDVTAAVSADTKSAAIPLGSSPTFNFDFYGASYTSAVIDENGFIGFVTGDFPANANAKSYTPATIPTAAVPNNYVAGMFVDMDDSCGGTVTYGTVGTSPNREFVVQWLNVPLYNGLSCASKTVSFQIRLQETSSNILIVLKDASWVPNTDSTDEGTLIGIEQDGTASHGLEYFFQTNADSTAISISSRAILFYRDNPPTTNSPAVTLNEDCSATTSTSTCVTPVSVSLTASDSDAGDGISGYCIVSPGPAKGSLAGTVPSTCPAYSGSGAAFSGLTYKPNGNYCGTDSFKFRSRDTNGPVFSSDGTATMTITCVADAPAATADSYTLNEDCSAGAATTCVTPFTVTTACPTGTSKGVKCNDVDVDDVPSAPSTTHRDAAQASIVTAPTHIVVAGDFSLAADGSFSYKPTSNYCGSDSFTYKLKDDDSPTGLTPTPYYGNTVTVSLTITCINDTPTASNDPTGYPGTCFQVLQDSLMAANTLDVLANDADNGDTGAGQGPAGTLAVLSVTAPANAFSSSQVYPSSPGTAVRYQPQAGWTGSDSFSYTMQDGNGGTATASICISVLVPDPRAVADSFTVNEEATYTASACAANQPAANGGPYYGVLCLDVDNVNDAVTAVLSGGQPANTLGPGGVWSWDPGNKGLFTYRATDNYCNSNPTGTPDTFQYTMMDGASVRNTVTVSMTVTCLNDAPVASASAPSLAEDTPTAVAMSATDPDTPYGDTLSYCVSSPPTHGSYPISACPTYTASSSATFTPTGNYCGPDMLSFKATDAAGLTSSATVSVSIGCMNDPPTAVDDTYTGVLGHPLDTAARGFAPVVANDVDPDSPYAVQGLSVVTPLCAGISKPGASLVMDYATGHFTYTPVGTTQYSDSFSYKVKDNSNAPSAACATVALTIKPDQPPTTRFVASPTSPHVGDPVNFVDGSSDPDNGDAVTGWSWNFGDGTTSRQSSPVHTYGAVGTYSACLVATDQWGVDGTGTCKTITVLAASGGSASSSSSSGTSTGSGTTSNGGPGSGNNGPTAGPLGASAGTAQTAAPSAIVILHAVATGASAPTYLWQQTSGPTVALSSATSSSPTFTAPSSPAELYFQLTVSDGGKTALAAVAVSVKVPAAGGPHARIAALAPSAVGQTVTLDGSASSGTGSLSYAWVQWDGTPVVLTDPMSATATFVVPANGATFSFALEVTDDVGSSTATQTVSVVGKAAATPPFAGPGFLAPTVVDGTVTVTPTGPGGPYTWDFGDNSPPQTTTGATTHHYGAPGSYVVTMHAVAFGTTIQLQQTAVVAAPEAASRDASPSQGGISVGLVVTGGVVLLAVVAALLVVLLRRRPGLPGAP